MMPYLLVWSPCALARVTQLQSEGSEGVVAARAESQPVQAGMQGVLCWQLTTAEGVDMDVSINSAGGAHAAALVARHMAAFPALRPLALTLKALLRAAAPAPLNDVAVGGLGSYSLINMLVAHLMLDAQVRTPYCASWTIPASVSAARHACGDHDTCYSLYMRSGAQRVLRIRTLNPKSQVQARWRRRGARRATGAACCWGSWNGTGWGLTSTRRRSR